MAAAGAVAGGVDRGDGGAEGAGGEVFGGVEIDEQPDDRFGCFGVRMRRGGADEDGVQRISTPLLVSPRQIRFRCQLAVFAAGGVPVRSGLGGVEALKHFFDESSLH